MENNSTINFDNLEYFSPREIAEFIYEKMNEEVLKDSDEIDCDFLREGTLLLLEFQGKEKIEISEKQFNVALKKLLKEYRKRKAEKKKAEAPPKKRISFKKIFLVAALIAIFTTASVIVVGANDPYTSHSLKQIGLTIKELFTPKVEKGNITYINQTTDEVKNYASVEEFVKGENIEGLYFIDSWEIEKIVYSEYGEKKKMILNPMEKDLAFSISVTSYDASGIEQEISNYKVCETLQGTKVFLLDKEGFESETGSTQVMFKIGQWYYRIQTSHPEIIIETIDSFREIIP